MCSSLSAVIIRFPSGVITWALSIDTWPAIDQHTSGRGLQQTYQEDKLRPGFEKGQLREYTWAVSRRKGRQGQDQGGS